MRLVRTSGTFSYISGYASFLSFVSFLAIGYNMARGWRLKNNISPMLALVLVVGAMFTTGSRAPVFTLIATGPIILWLAASNGLLSSRTAMRLCVLIPVIAIAALSISPRATEAFMARAGEGRFVLYAHASIFAVRSDHRGALLWTCFGLWHRNHEQCRLHNNGNHGPMVAARPISRRRNGTGNGRAWRDRIAAQLLFTMPNRCVFLPLGDIV